jgi:hypothetical protein
MRGIFGPKCDEITGECRKHHSEELHDLYSSHNIVRVIKPRRIRWARYVEHMGKAEACTRFWLENLMERDHLGDPGLNGRIILRWIFREWDLVYGLDWVDSG